MPPAVAPPKENGALPVALLAGGLAAPPNEKLGGFAGWFCAAATALANRLPPGAGPAALCPNAKGLL